MMMKKTKPILHSEFYHSLKHRTLVLCQECATHYGWDKIYLVKQRTQTQSGPCDRCGRLPS
jgi:hypothetical protein